MRDHYQSKKNSCFNLVTKGDLITLEHLLQWDDPINFFLTLARQKCTKFQTWNPITPLVSHCWFKVTRSCHPTMQSVRSRGKDCAWQPHLTVLTERTRLKSTAKQKCASRLRGVDTEPWPGSLAGGPTTSGIQAAPPQRQCRDHHWGTGCSEWHSWFDFAQFTWHS